MFDISEDLVRKFTRWDKNEAGGRRGTISLHKVSASVMSCSSGPDRMDISGSSMVRVEQGTETYLFPFENAV